VLVVYFFYYESSQLTLEMVDEMYCDKSVKPWQSSQWTPKGYASRFEAAEAEKEDYAIGEGIHKENVTRNGETV